MKNIHDLKEVASELMIERSIKKDAIKKLKQKEKELQELLSAQNEALILLQETAKETQNNLTKNMQNIVTNAIKSVFGDDYSEFSISFESTRNKTECQLRLKDGEELIIPEGNSGGGLMDIISNALRFGFWALVKNRPVFILDEPFKALNGSELKRKGAEVLKQLSQELNVQMIIVSDLDHFKKIADSLFEVNKEGKISKVNQLR